MAIYIFFNVLIFYININHNISYKYVGRHISIYVNVNYKHYEKYTYKKIQI